MRKQAMAMAFAGAIAVMGVSAPSASAGPQALSCNTSVGDTGGWAECTGSGTWRVRSVCSWTDTDKYTQWITTNKKTRVYATDCNFNIVDVVVQMK